MGVTDFCRQQQKPQIFAGKRRVLQKPVSPICCLPFGAFLLVGHWPRLARYRETISAEPPYLKGRQLTPKTTHPNKNSLHQQFAQTLLPLFCLFYREVGGRQFIQTVPKLFAQTVFSFGWVFFFGGSPLHEYPALWGFWASQHEELGTRCHTPLLQ